MRWFGRKRQVAAERVADKEPWVPPTHEERVKAGVNYFETFYGQEWRRHPESVLPIPVVTPAQREFTCWMGLQAEDEDDARALTALWHQEFSTEDLARHAGVALP